MSADNEVAILNVDGKFWVVRHQVSLYTEELTSKEILEAFEGGIFCMSQEKALQVASEEEQNHVFTEYGITQYYITGD